MMIGLIGRKIGMTQIFSEKGQLLPVTVLEAGPCPVIQVKTPERDGYAAAQLGFGEVKEIKLSKAERGHLASHGGSPLRHLREFRLPDGGEVKQGDVLTVGQFEVGSRVDVIGTSKGKGFQGVVKRHHYHGGPASHGSKTGDMPGSVGASAWPSHVVKGRRLPGHMGDARITAKGVRVVKIDSDRNLVLVEGSIPGGSNGLVLIRPIVRAKQAKKGR
jgi:large subunit ribosomal protein L3